MKREGGKREEREKSDVGGRREGELKRTKVEGVFDSSSAHMSAALNRVDYSFMSRFIFFSVRALPSMRALPQAQLIDADIFF